MKKLSLIKPMSLFLSLLMAVGIFSGLTTQNANAYSLPSQTPTGYSGLGYFLAYHNEVPEVINPENNLALANVQARIKTINNRDYLHISYDYEMSMAVWGVTGMSTWFGPSQNFGGVGEVNSGSVNFTVSHNAAYGYCGPDGKVEIKYEVNGKTYTSTQCRVNVPANQYVCYENYYGWDREYDILLGDGAVTGSVSSLKITSILGQTVNLTVTKSGSSYLDVFKSANIIAHKSNGNGTDTYTVRITGCFAQAGYYNVKFGTSAGEITEEAYFTSGNDSEDVEVTISSSSYNLYIKNIVLRSTNKQFTGYHQLTDLSYTIDYNQNPTSSTWSAFLKLKTSFNYSIHTKGEYTFYFSYIVYDENNRPSKEYNSETYDLQSLSGTIQDSVAFPKNATAVKLYGICSPDHIFYSVNYLLYEGNIPMPSEFSATVNPTYVHTNVYHIIHTAVEYGAPANGTYSITVEYDKPDGTTATQTRTFYARAGYNTFYFGENGVGDQPWQIPVSATYVRMISITGPNGYSQECNQYWYGSAATPENPADNQNEGVREFVKRLYLVALGREEDPSETEIQYWYGCIVDQGQSASMTGSLFIFSDEFRGRNLTNEQYVVVLYETFMGRDPYAYDENGNNDAAGVQFWAGLLDSGYTRESIFVGFVTTNEWAGICNQYGVAV